MVNYVLVCDVTDNGRLYYYEGYFVDNISVNSNEYTKAAKLCYKSEAEKLCNIINEVGGPFKYHVEEHAYFVDAEIK